MTDDAFQLTPHDVRAQEFQRVMRGFDPVQVEDFKSRIAEELDRLIRNRVGTEERLKGMTEQLRAYRERERALNDALVAAQQLRADAEAAATRDAELTMREAQQEAEAVLQEARQEAGRIVEAAHADQDRIRGGMEDAARQYGVYLSSFRTLLERQLAEVNALEKHRERSGSA
ncbi:MAG TPA: DivIVA domain-containing protein [Gemmatimonadales bacterium]|nr:DivIVA domain-containing protein [Gemmatimonadales bacterium]